MAELERDLEFVREKLADVYEQSVYLGGLQSALVWVEQRRESHAEKQERYVKVVNNLPEIQKTLEFFSNTVMPKEKKWQV